MEKGAGSDPNHAAAADTAVPRGACTLLPHARENKLVTYISGHPADWGLDAANVVAPNGTAAARLIPR